MSGTNGNARVGRRLASTALLAMLALSATAKAGDPPAAAAQRPTTVLCTVTPIRLLALEVVGETTGVACELLLAADVGCPHDYTLTVRDKRKVEEAAAVLCIGEGYEAFLDPIRRTAPDKFLTITAGCDWIETCTHDHHHDHAHDHSHDHARNAHVWMSPAQAIKLVEGIEKALSRLDPPRAEQYAKNAAAARERLTALRAEAESLAKRVRGKRVAASEAFAYLARDLGLDVALQLPDHEVHGAAARDTAEVLRKAREAKLVGVLIERGARSKLADAVLRESGAPQIDVDTLIGEGAAGATYFSRMRSVYLAIEAALAEKQRP
ncbi:MAG: zinc ABC transporter substrate-binding protein [Phycisphaerales bacterium]|nr:zinc ABC transporter substrate-binding protein [Phycisphaerales bacterium]